MGHPRKRVEIKPVLCNESIILTEEQKSSMIEEATKHYDAFLRSLAIAVDEDHNTMQTAHRVAKMFVNELCAGRFSPPPNLTSFRNISEYDDLIITNCDIKSMCAHHMMPIVGSAYILVLPKKGKPLIGLSKYDRVVNFYARRPQIQEELTRQILSHITDVMKPEAAGVIIDAKHYCRCHRGVQGSGMMRTAALSDSLRESDYLAKEFYNYVNVHRFTCG